MDNQHRQVAGYRDFDQSTVDQINSIKEAEKDIGALWQQIAQIPGIDKRALSHAKTQLQDGFSWFVRAVAKPADPFGDLPK